MDRVGHGATPLRTVPIMAWYVLALMTVDNVLSQIDRNAVSILKTTLKQEFELSDTDYGILVTAFLVPFAVFFVICGQLVDKFGSRVTLTGFASVWSLATIAFAMSNSFTELVIWRAVLGAAEAGLMPATIYALVSWFPKDRIATIYAIKNPLQALGPILTPPLIAGLALAFGWRMAFIIPGTLGLFFALLWWFADRNPPSYVSLKPDSDKVAPKLSLVQLAKSPIIWGVLAARLISDPTWFFFQNWQAGYLQERLGWSLQEVGQLLWIPPLANIVFILIMAWLSDALIARGWNPARSRIRIIQVLALLAPFIAILPFVENPAIVLVLLTLIYFMTFTWAAFTNILMADLFPKHQVGSAVGLINCVGTVGAAMFNFGVGPIIEAHGYLPVFFGLALLHPIAAVLLQIFYADKLRADPLGKNVTSGDEWK
jgi:ACS family hexuronate transporter-like MFS transporter